MKYFALTISIITLIIAGYLFVQHQDEKAQKEAKATLNYKIEQLTSQITTAKVKDCIEEKDYLVSFSQEGHNIQTVKWSTEQAQITKNGETTCYEMDWKLSDRLQLLGMWFMTQRSY